MNFMPVILWTDAMVFLLIAVGIIGTLWIRRRPHLLLPWQRVAKHRVGMVSLLLLLFFVLIGVLDSLHYRAALPDKNQAQTVYSPEVLSLFDTLVGELRTHTEKTYSAPLAAYLYAKESISQPDGSTLRDYPRLKYGGAHLADPEHEWQGDVVKRTMLGAGAGLLVGLGLCAVWFRKSLINANYFGNALLCSSPDKGRLGGVSGLASSTENRTPLPLPLIRGSAAFVQRVLKTCSPSHSSNPPIPPLSGGVPTASRAVPLTLLILSALIGATLYLASAYHVLGTDKVGIDVLYLALKSIRTGLVIGTVTTLVMLPFALLLGIAAGYLRGWVDDAIQYLYTVLSSIPSVLLIAAAVLMMQVVIETHADWFDTAAARADVRLLCLCAILGVTSWTGLCRLLRGETLKLRELEYIQAAQAFGVSPFKILTRHILPNVMHIVLISVVMEFSALVLAEAVLSYVGVGVDPSTISFGTLINAARLEMGREPMVWWTLAAAFGFMLVLVLAANLFADAVRDAFDPRLNRSHG